MLGEPAEALGLDFAPTCLRSKDEDVPTHFD
jgi:hypothetical protein